MTAFRPLRRRSIQRLSQEQWGTGRSIWSADAEDRQLIVDRIVVTEESPPEWVADILGVAPGKAACVRRRRFVLDGKPVLLSTSHFPADLVAGSAITRKDTGAGGAYARLAELGAEPVRFREEVRSRMPTSEEIARLELAAGMPVVLICRIAFADGGRPVEVNEMVLDSSSYVLEYEFDA